MSIEVTPLRNVSTTSIDRIRQSFADAGSAYSKAVGRFDREVYDKLKPKHEHVWTGDGSHEARSVLETNSVAFAAAQVLADAAQLVLQGFHTATDHAQRHLEDTLLEGFKVGIDVKEDGTAYIVDDQTYHEPEHLSGANSSRPADLAEIKDRVERKVKGCLEFEKIADRSCAQMLDGLRTLLPRTTDYYDPSALDQNRRALADALSARSLAHKTSEFWHAAKPKALPKDDTPERMQGLCLDAIALPAASGAAVLGDVTDIGVIAKIVGLGTWGKKGRDSLLEDAWKNMFPDKTRKHVTFDAPGKADKILADAAEHGKVSQKTLDDHETGTSFTPRSHDTDGQSPRPGEPPAGGDHAYERYTLDTGSGRKEWVIVDTDTGDAYYCDHFEDGEPTSFTKIT